MPTVITAGTTWRCPTCGDGCGWVRWRLAEGWLWAACADCNDVGAKPKPPVCPVCAVTRPFCRCRPSRSRRA